MMIVTDASPTYVVSLVILGDSGVGKTALMKQFVSGEFSPEGISTVGVEYGTRTVSIHEKTLQLRISDTAGQERFKAISLQYYRRAAGVLLVYDVTRRAGFEGLDAWVDKIRDAACANVTIMAVGNKKDLEGQRVVSYDEGKAFADRKDILFLETSASDAFSAEDAFMNLTIAICDKIDRQLLRNESHGITVLKSAAKTRADSIHDLRVKDIFQKKREGPCC
ncbi:hypothetical protein EMPS_10435 [Entomortierella parvispora]|uniref:Uncharacterized protein n=1 Tax=Entomortierella parvispora TaxID=205924 RepID=A0A9P3HK32_9FUNG|nr:hypothetical protein EMPS_10435 [Entomortierella parvispora]